MEENLHHVESASLVNLVHCGGLAHPTPYCYAVSTLVYQYYSHISQNEYLLGKFLKRRHHREMFMAAISKKIIELNLSASLLEIKCKNGNIVFNLIASKLFNTFSKNTLKRLNDNSTDKPSFRGSLANNRKVRKLQSHCAKS